MSTTVEISILEQQISKELETATNDREKVDILNHAAEEYYDKQPLFALDLSTQARDIAQKALYSAGEAYSFRNSGAGYLVLSRFTEALAHIQHALQLFIDIDDTDGQAASYTMLGIIYFYLGQYDSALEAQSNALIIYEQQTNKRMIASSLGNISIIYLTVGQYDEALSHSLKALATQEEMKDTLGTAITANNIGGLFIRLGHYDTALKYLEQSIEVSRQLNNKFGISKALRNIGIVHEQKKDYHTALEYQSQAIVIIKELDDKQGFIESLTLMGVSYQKINDFSTALSYHATALKACLQIGEQKVQVEILKNIGDCYTSLHNFAKAIEYLNKAYELAQKIGIDDTLVEVHFSYSKTYEAMNNYREALRHYAEWAKLRDKILGSEKQKLIAVMETRLAIEKAMKEKEIFRLRNIELTQAFDELEEKRHSLAAAYQQIESQQIETIKINHEMEFVNLRLVELNKEKNELLGIVAHDLKNFVTGMVMSGESIRRYYDKLSADEIFKIGERIETVAHQMMNLIHGLLDANTIESGKINYNIEKINLNELIPPLIESYTSSSERKNITLKVEYDEKPSIILVDSDRVLQVMDNLVSNAVKYSYPSTTITVRLRNFPSTVRFEVQDEGPGISAEEQPLLFKRFQRLSAKPTGGEHSSGLGLANAQKLIQGMGGQIWCESELGKGSNFIFEFPVI